jgi:hypothetical protein
MHLINRQAASLAGVLAWCLFPLASCAGAADGWAPFIGEWEYRQANSARAEGVDPEGERLEIVREGGAVAVRYFGLEREGEHGLFYTATDVGALSLAEGGTLTFTVPARRLFSRRPESLDAARAAVDDRAGVTREELVLTGRIQDGRLVLFCSSDGAGCPERAMTFRKRGGPMP